MRLIESCHEGNDFYTRESMAKQKKDESEYIHADFPAKWIKAPIDEKLKNEDFRKILDFFVIHTPCEELSARAKTLNSYQWENTYPLKKGMRVVPLKDSIFSFGEKWEEMKDCLAEVNLQKNFPSALEIERGCLYKKSKQNQLDCIFYHIRNCFAHGRFNISENNGDWTFVLEDWGTKNRVSARMILKKSTLLKWIEIIEGGEKTLTELTT